MQITIKCRIFLNIQEELVMFDMGLLNLSLKYLKSFLNFMCFDLDKVNLINILRVPSQTFCIIL